MDKFGRFEIIDGERVEMPPTTAHQSALVSRLCAALGPLARKDQGRVVIGALFQLNREGTVKRRPSIAFVSYKRWPRFRRVPDTDAWDVIPNLAIEVSNEWSKMGEMLQKVMDYFEAGVDQVWFIHPVVEQVYVYNSRSKCAILSGSDCLRGEAFFPGFCSAVAGVFEESNGVVPEHIAGPVS